MHLTIKLPPKSERDKIVDAYIEGLVQDRSYERLFKSIEELCERGYEKHGIMCMATHRSTFRIIRMKLADIGNKENMDAALAAPISLN